MRVVRRDWLIGYVVLRLFFPLRSYNFRLFAKAVVTVYVRYDGIGRMAAVFQRSFSQRGHIGLFILRPLWLDELTHGLLEGVTADAR